MSNDDDVLFIEKQFLDLPDFVCDEGWILDFGGGGEGVIGILKGTQVIAIDLRKSELEEALERDCKALLVEMDGTNLKFLDNTFPTATAFFSLMYVKEHEDLVKIFEEFYRVLKKGGRFLIWDANLNLPINSEKKVTAFYLDVNLPSGKKIQTGYGTRKVRQELNDFLGIAKKIGFKVNKSENLGIQFYLELEKE